MTTIDPPALRSALVRGLAKIDQQIEVLTQAACLRTRFDWQNQVDPPGRDLDREFGYPAGRQDARYFHDLIDSWGLAARVNSAYADECWAVPPDVYETEKTRNTAFEKAYKALDDQFGLTNVMHQWDVFAGYGEYGVTFLGLDDGLDPLLPAAGLDPRTGEPDPAPPPQRKLTFLRPAPQTYVRVAEWVRDWTSPRYGLPYSYDLAAPDERPALDPGETAFAPQAADASPRRWTRVNWTRVLHLPSDGGESSNPALGVPRLQRPLPYVLDARKVGGGSAEMFYKGAFPGLSLETHPEISADADLDAESVREEMDAYMNGLRRYLRLVGMTAKSLAPQIADPTNHLAAQFALISATIGVPTKILLGAEAGHLAGTQDTVHWNGRLAAKRVRRLTPLAVRPLAWRLAHLGVLPRPRQVQVAWNDLNSASDKDRADVALKRTQSLLQYVSSGAFRLVRPLHFLTLVMGLTGAEAAAVVDAAGGEDAVVKELSAQAALANGTMSPEATGTAPDRRTGAAGRRNGLGGTDQ